MAMEIISQDEGKVLVKADINISLANAIRRSVNEVPVLAIDECDIYKNDCALYDEVIAHRIGLVPLKNQKLKKDGKIEMKIKVKGKSDEPTEVLSGELGEDVVYSDMPIALLEKGQEMEIVARARQGIGKEHAKFVPGLVFYKQFPKITITKEGESHELLAKNYPEVFEFDGKLKVKNASACDLDQEDLVNFPGVNIELEDDLIFSIESWGQMKAKDILVGACDALSSNLDEVLKTLK